MSKATTFQVEVHLQEVFSGEEVRIYLGGQKMAELTARTRFQIGFAAIERLQATEGQEVTIQVGDRSTARATARRSHPFIIVRMTDGQVDVKTTENSPGYL